eukprot:TRINITY_DN20976_c0_g1_i1.p1 TRINITY_DN20976_c0_g1~~TRINITY_DN20976_c0_g1_i1.p1  ORF type:complete len:434 (-),score=74.63 TRINITY_DN20976_c0_g1_i1:204-1505(-)
MLRSLVGSEMCIRDRPSSMASISPGLELVNREDGAMAVRAESCLTEFRSPQEWSELMRASLHTRVVVDGGVNDGIMERYEVAHVVKDNPDQHVLITGRLFVQLADQATADALLSTLPCVTHPRRLAEFGCEVGDTGSVRAIAEGLPKDGFLFWNETQFQLVREARLVSLWSELESGWGMEQVIVNGAPVLCSSDYRTNSKLLLIIPGLGYGRPGIFGRNLLTLTGIVGSMLPQVQRALTAGWGVMLLNPNFGIQDPVPENPMFADRDWWLDLGRDQVVVSERDADWHMQEHYKRGKSWEHCQAAWEQLVSTSAAEQIACIGHSAGGSCLINLLQHDEAAQERVKAVALSDCYELEGDPVWEYARIKSWMHKVAKGWYIGADLPLDQRIEWIPNMYSCSDDLDFECVSSGCNAHNRIPYNVLNSMFDFIESKFE